MKFCAKTLMVFCYICACVYTVNSLIKVEDTVPKKHSYPALILKGLIIQDPAVPNDIVTEDNIEKFKFEIFNKFHLFENVDISYACQKGSELKLAENKTAECQNQLRLTTLKTGKTCGSSHTHEYHVGYGAIDKNFFFNTKGEKKVQYPLYVVCFDEKENKTMHVQYEMARRNNLYYKSNRIYSKKREEISKLASDFRDNVSERILPKKLREKNEHGSLIPFQLLSHEDALLYNWKIATFHEMNYSLIWSNIADNTWKKLNREFRKLMIDSNYDLDIYTGTHDYSDDGYPRYLWKFVRSYFKSIAIIVHNHPPNDTKDYDFLCKNDNNCEVYGFGRNQLDKNLGLFYCCPLPYLKSKIPFFKNGFVEIEPLNKSQLISNDSLQPYPSSFIHDYDDDGESNVSSKLPTQNTSN